MENLFEYYIETDRFHFKYAKGEPALKEQEFHDYSELVFFNKKKETADISQQFLSNNVNLL